ncbi:MAG: hypothetical protein LBM77_06350 [Spirochaetaceae bacterium]|jgi:hypothetical protein|nr:hypothetical protein [Spirochaetaceae bacterium]
MVYLAKKNGEVVHHTDKAAMKALDGISKADMEVEDDVFEAAGGLARIIDGEIFLGKTDAEKTAEANAERSAEINRELAAIDAKSARASRAVAIAVSEGRTPDAGDVSKLTGLESQANALRTELAGLAQAA